MPKSQIDSTALIAAVLAAALALMLLSGSFVWLGSIGGMILLLLMFAYDQEGYRTIFQSLVFAAVCGFCLTVASAVFYHFRAGGVLAPTDPQIAGKWLPLTCAFGTVLFWIIDRARMSGREAAISGAESPRRTTTQRTFVPASAAAEATTYVPPVQVSSEREHEPSVAPAAYDAAAQPDEAVREPAQTTAQEIPRSAPFVQPIASPVQSTVQTVPAPAAPATVLSRPGKETMIYVGLVGEGLNVLRSVRAEHLGRDFYRIVDSMPEGEVWEFQPQQVVRCKKKNLSSGKALVAIEEAPRAS